MGIDVEEMRDKLSGLYVLMVTPFKANFDLDLEGLRKNVRFLLDNGIRGEAGILVPGAGIGEGECLSLEEHRDLVKAVLAEVDGEVPVFPGVHHTSTLETEKYCKQLQDMGAAGTQLRPPAAIPTDEEIVTHYKRVAEAAPKLGLIAYNTFWAWGLTPGRDMSPDLMGRLLEIKNFVGVKWASKTPSNFIACLDEHAGKGAFFNNMGLEVLIPFHLMGGRSPVVDQFAPWYYLKLQSLLEERKYAEVWDELERWAFPFARLKKDIVSQGGHWVAVAKALIEVSGLHAGPPRPPQTPLTRAQYGRIEDLVKETGIMQH